jgi:iron uptake system component EfeO
VAGNVEGARAAYSTLRPALAARDPKLARLLDRQFTAMSGALAQYRTASGYRPYRSVTGTARAELQARLETLAEGVSALVSAFQR